MISIILLKICLEILNSKLKATKYKLNFLFMFRKKNFIVVVWVKSKIKYKLT